MTGSHGDTSLAGGAKAFPATTGGLVGRFAGLETQDYRECLGDLAARYWKPVYTFIRMAWNKSNEDAKDLTQAFFLWLTEREALRRYAPERGGFRKFLKVLLRRFLGHEDEARLALKRGGAALTLSLQDGEKSLERVIAGPDTDPDVIFDRAWTVSIMKVAVDRVRERLRAQDREALFRAFELHDLADSGVPPSYEDVAHALGLKESQVRDYLHVVREEVRAEIRSELSSMTRDSAELEEEWRDLFGT